MNFVRASALDESCVEARVRRPSPDRNEGSGDGRFIFRLETADGAPADPPTLEAAVSTWPLGSMIYLGIRPLRVIAHRDDRRRPCRVFAVWRPIIEPGRRERPGNCGYAQRPRGEGDSGVPRLDSFYNVMGMDP
jgi:hypothetical protein